MTPEEREEHLKRTKKGRDDNLTKKERDEKRMKTYMNYVARLSRLSPEEREERKKRRRERANEKKRLLRKTDEYKEKNRLYRQMYVWNMDRERRELYLQKRREYYRKRRERLKAEGRLNDPELKEYWRKRRIAEKQMLEGKVEGVEVNKRGPLAHLTIEERAQRLKEQRLGYGRKRRLKERLALQKLLDQGMSMEEARRQMVTPARLEYRRMQARMNLAKGRLRKKLVACGVPEEEIQVQLNELVARYQSQEPRNPPYKPRPNRFKPIEPDELKLLKGSESAPQSSSIISPSKSSSSNSIVDTSISNVMTSPPPQPTPTAASCSYVSISSTPEPEPVHYQQQYQTPQYFSNTHHHPIQSHSQSQTYSSLQFIDNMNYNSNENPHACMQSSTTPISAAVGVSDNSSSYGEDITSHPHYFASPPPSPDFSPETEYPRRRGPGRPRKTCSGTTTSINPKPKKNDNLSGGGACGSRVKGLPYGTRIKDAARTKVCDECGFSFTPKYFRQHKREFHNPHYKNGRCDICQEEFAAARTFYNHYRKVHCNNQRLPPVGVSRGAGFGNYQCEGCGRAFNKHGNMKLHWYYMHGPGHHQENFHRCHLCPPEEERKFKQKLTLLKHFKQCHPDYNSGEHQCSRCLENFLKEEGLQEHVKSKHPEAYFPCRFCKVVKFSQLGINFHYSRACYKIPTEERIKLREEMGDEGKVESIPVKCEFCGTPMRIQNLMRHYRIMHGVREDNFSCMRCDKTFKVRDYLAAHLIDQHNMPKEEWIDEVCKLNVKDRYKVEVKNLGKVMLNPDKKPKLRKALRCKKKQRTNDGVHDEGGEEASKSVKRHPKAASKSNRGRPRKKKVTSDEEESEAETSANESLKEDDELKNGEHGRNRRNRKTNDADSLPRRSSLRIGLRSSQRSDELAVKTEMPSDDEESASVVSDS